MSKIILIALFFISALSVSAAAQPKIPDSVMKKADSLLKKLDTSKINQLLIDTGKTNIQVDTTKIDTAVKLDSALMQPVSENVLTNTKLFIYIILSVLGIAAFFFLFVQTLFKTFHKTRSTRQSLLLSWNLFFIVSIIWIFIIWGIVAGFWGSGAFMVTMIFLFIVSLIMLIIAVKSK
jgi:hypothetical protein